MPSASRARKPGCGSCVACKAKDCGAPSPLFARILRAPLPPRPAIPRDAEKTCPTFSPTFPAGECINCQDKTKYGGLGVRKQSCLARRCTRNWSQPADAASRSDAWDPTTAGARALLALTGGGEEDDDWTTSESGSIDGRSELERGRERLKSMGAEGDASSAFTVQLATMLAADETALSQPIALRVLQQSGLLRPSTAPGDAQGVALPPMFSQAQR